MKKHQSNFRWVVFFSVLFTYVLMSSQRTAPGLITDQLMVDFGVTAATIGLLTSIQYFVYTGLQLPMGIWADRYGPNFLLIIGATITGIGTIIYSLSTHAFVLFFARILTGLGDATIWVNLVLILGHWFSAKEFNRLIGWAGMTGSLGFLLATVPIASLIGQIGWRNSFVSLGSLLTVCGILLYFVLVKKPKELLLTETETITKSRAQTKFWHLLKRISSSRQAWALFLCHFGIVGGYVGFLSSWAVPYGMDMYGLTRAEASQLNMVSLVGALIGAPLASFITSRLQLLKKPYLVVYIILFLSWSSFLVFKGNPPLPILYIIFTITGLCFGACMITFSIVRQTFPLVEAGLVTGFANTGGFLSAVLLPGIFGIVLDYYQTTTGSLINGYQYGFIIPVVFTIFGLAGVLIVKEKMEIGTDGKEKKGGQSPIS